MKIKDIDHIVLTVADIEETCKFYSKVLGMDVITFENGQRKALKFGKHKINLHQKGKELEPKAINPIPGSMDICFISYDSLQEVIEHLSRNGVKIIEGPILKSGSNGRIKSIYIHDPDLNLVEISNYVKKE
jgi:catechol 2,3-dioxygenase-like lactoylglutathione lyase family enzyme